MTRNPFRKSPVVICCYAKLHPATKRSVNFFAPDAEFIDTSGDPYAYRDAIKSHWTGKRDLIVIEQDIEITEEVVPSFSKCAKPWCTFSYQGPPALGYLYRGLGCAKFSAKLQRKIPFSEFVEYGMDWRAVDGYISRILWVVRGISPHVHGHVAHHHEYEDDPNSQHTAYAVEWQPDGRRFVYENYTNGKRGRFVREFEVPSWAGRG